MKSCPKCGGNVLYDYGEEYCLQCGFRKNGGKEVDTSELLEKINNCPEFQTCPKISMVLDKDLLDFQYREAVMDVCGRCIEEKEKSGFSIS